MVVREGTRLPLERGKQRETNNSKRRKDARLHQRGLQRMALAAVVAEKRGIPKKQALAEVTPPGLLARLAALAARYQ